MYSFDVLLISYSSPVYIIDIKYRRRPKLVQSRVQWQRRTCTKELCPVERSNVGRGLQVCTCREYTDVHVYVHACVLVLFSEGLTPCTVYKQKELKQSPQRCQYLINPSMKTTRMFDHEGWSVAFMNPTVHTYMYIHMYMYIWLQRIKILVMHSLLV